MYERLHTLEPVDDFTTDVLSEYEVGSRHRRPPRVVPLRDLRRQANQAQQASGVRVRLWRKVLNEEALYPIHDALERPHQEGNVRRRSLRQFTMTVYDSGQHPLRNPWLGTEDELTETLNNRRPQLFAYLRKVTPMGISSFGSAANPFLALTLPDKVLQDDLQTIRGVVAPELLLSDLHLPDHRPHVTVGKITVANAVQRDQVTTDMLSMLEPLQPRRLDFGGLQMTIEPLEC